MILNYQDLPITIQIKKRSVDRYEPDSYDEKEIFIDYDYDAYDSDVIDFIIENTKGNYTENYIKNNFEEIVDKYYDQLLDYFYDEARDEAQENSWKYVDKYTEAFQRKRNKMNNKSRIREAIFNSAELSNAYKYLTKHKHYEDENDGTEYFAAIINEVTLNLKGAEKNAFYRLLDSDDAVEQIDNLVEQILDYYIPPRIDYYLTDDSIIIILLDKEYNYNMFKDSSNSEEMIRKFALQQVGYKALKDRDIMRDIRDQLADFIIECQEKVEDFDDAMKYLKNIFAKFLKNEAEEKNNKKINEDYDNINQLYNYLHLHKHYVEKGKDYFSADVKVWDLDLTDEQEDEFFEMLRFEDGGMEDFLNGNEELLTNIEMVGRNGGHLILKDESLDPSDYRSKYADVEYADWLDYHYFPGELDGVREEWEEKVKEDYEKVVEFDQIVENLKELLKQYIDERIENKNSMDEDLTKTMFEDVAGKEPELDSPEFDEINFYDPDEWDKYDYLDNYEEDVEEDEDCRCERELDEYYDALEKAQDELPDIEVKKNQQGYIDTPECKLNEDVSYSDLPEVRINFVNKARIGISPIKNLINEFESQGFDIFKVRTTRFGSNISDGDVNDAWLDFKRQGWSVEKWYDKTKPGFQEFYIVRKINKTESLSKYNDDVKDLEEKFNDSTLNERKGVGEIAEEVTDISNGDYEAHLNYLNNQLNALKKEKNFLETQAPREVGKGGNFDNNKEIDKALEQTNKEIDSTQLKIDLITKMIEEK